MVKYKTGTTKSGKTYRVPTTATLGGGWADSRRGGGYSGGSEGQREPEVRHDWKQVGTSRTGTPIWENEVGERRAQGREPAVNVSGIRGAGAPQKAYDYYVSNSGASVKVDKGASAPMNSMKVSEKLYVHYNKEQAKRVKQVEKGQGFSPTPSVSDVSASSVSSSTGAVQTVSAPAPKMAGSPGGGVSGVSGIQTATKTEITPTPTRISEQPQAKKKGSEGWQRVAEMGSVPFAWFEKATTGKQQRTMATEKVYSTVLGGTDQSKVVVGKKDHSGFVGGLQDVAQFVTPQSKTDVAIISVPGVGAASGKSFFAARKGTQAVTTKVAGATARKTTQVGTVKVAGAVGRQVGKTGVKKVAPKTIPKPTEGTLKLTQGLQKVESVGSKIAGGTAKKTGLAAFGAKTYGVAQKTGATKAAGKASSIISYPEKQLGKGFGKFGQSRIGRAVGQSKIARGGGRVGRELEKTGTGRLVKDLPKVTAKTEVVRIGTEEFRQVTAPQDIKRIRGEMDLGSLQRAGQASQRKALGLEVGADAGFGAKAKAYGSNIVGSVAYELPIANLYVGTGGYKSGIKEELQRQGFKPGTERYDTAFKAAMRQRKTSSFSEGASFLYVSKESERIGRREVSSAFSDLAVKGKKVPEKQLGSELFKTTFAPIGRAGFVEGSVSEFEQARARKEKVKPINVLLMGGIGFGSAGFIGGGIAALKPKSPGKSLAVETLASIADPFEKPGDILETGLEKFAVKRGKAVVESPRIKIRGSSEPMAIFDTGEAFNPFAKAKVSPKSKVPVSPFAPAQIPPLSKVSSESQTKTEKNENIPKDDGIIVIDGGGKIDTPVNPFQQSFSFSESPVNTNTFADTFTFSTNIPSVTPQLRVPTPLPLSFPATSGGMGGRRKGRRKFANELEAAMGIIQKDISRPVVKQPQKVKKGKRRQAVRKNPFSIF